MSPLSKHRVLLIGGAGFIGHHVALELAKKSAEVFVLDSLQVNNFLSLLSPPHIPNRDFYLRIVNERLNLLRKAKVPILTGDARDYHLVTKIIGDIKPTVIVHLAAVAHANISNKDPYSTFDHSLRTLENALDACRGGSVEHFVFFSSSMIYGNFPAESVTEETPCKPIGIYGALKLAGEQIVTAYNQVFGLPYTIIRPSALYGERCVSRRVGQLFIENALSGLEVSIEGDGSARLDFTYAKDLVHGVMCVIENEKSRNEVFNITYGESRSIADMLEILQKNIGTDVKVKFIPKDNLTPSRGTLSVEKAKRLIGYEPSYPLELGFADYITWYKKFSANGDRLS
jgi:nucleoside-diphosphate-sugar epimerase